MLSTRGLLSLIQRYMPEEPQSQVVEHLNRAYLKLATNDIPDFSYLVCNRKDLEFSFPVLKRTYIDPLLVDPDAPMPICVDILATNFEDELGNSIATVDDILFNYRGIGVTCRKINAFFVRKSQERNYFPINQTPYEPFSPYYNDGYAGRGLLALRGNLEFSRFPGNFRPASQIAPANVFFNSRPYGDVLSSEVGDIYIDFWFTPPVLTNADSLMLLDTDKWQSELINGSVGYWEDQVNGFSEKMEKFEKFDRKEFKSEGNSNMHNRGNSEFKVRSIG